MSYATEADLRLRFGDAEVDAFVTNLAAGGHAGVLRALDDADAEIDTYLAGRFALPLPSVPSVLVRIACDIARYRMWSDEASEEVRTRYEDVRRFLESLARGTVRLGLPDATPAPASQALAAAQAGDPPVFTRAGTAAY